LPGSATPHCLSALPLVKGAATDAAQRKALRLIVVVTDRDQSPPSAQGFPILTRPSTITDDAESFIADLAGLLRAIAAETGVARQAEPQTRPRNIGRLWSLRWRSLKRSFATAWINCRGLKLRERSRCVPLLTGLSSKTLFRGRAEFVFLSGYSSGT